METEIVKISVLIFFLVLAFVTGYNAGVSHTRHNMLLTMRKCKGYFVGEWLEVFGDESDKTNAI